MLSHSDAHKITEKIIHFFPPKAFGRIEVMIANSSRGLTRFADNIITQNVCENNLMGASVRVMKGGKVGRVSFNQVDDITLKSAAEKCRYLACSEPFGKPQGKLREPVKTSAYGGRNGAEMELLPRQRYVQVSAFDTDTASVTPEQRADAIKSAVLSAIERSTNISGIYSTDNGSITIANSRGLFAHYLSTSAQFTCTALTSDSSGKALAISKNYKQIKPQETARIAIDNALKSRGPIEIPAGAYTVILDPSCVVEFLSFLARFVFSALSYQEGRAFTSGKLGTKIMGENITITDDAYHPDILGMPFDFEGMPRGKVALITKGVASGLVHDRLTARQGKTKSTGHSLPQPNPHGPLPLHLVLSPGESSIQEMISTTQKGILVSGFHYTNILDPMKMIITGMTRHGLFLIENGVITRSVKNMRFTDSIMRILSEVELISKESRLQPAFFGGGAFVAPALKARNFNFSSETKF
ncbi:MAG: TldD/PmbA family protein [Planctomycetota bacterium]|nr:TldD/PmbA family protein [Planctomycetota bacterium]MDI6788686.1 TldD/PmbA family protein [Planctomycetota bacterium]